jgi:hypothetical protein
MSATATAFEPTAATDEAETCAWRHDNVKALDRLLLQLAQEAARQPRAGGWLRADMLRLTEASEAALVATLLQRPMPEIREQLAQVHRQLARLVEMTCRSGRCTGRLHQDLCQARQRLQALERALH